MTSIFDHFSVNFESIFDQFWSIFKWFSVNFRSIFGQFWIDFSQFLINFSVNFWRILINILVIFNHFFGRILVNFSSIFSQFLVNFQKDQKVEKINYLGFYPGLWRRRCFLGRRCCLKVASWGGVVGVGGGVAACRARNPSPRWINCRNWVCL